MGGIAGIRGKSPSTYDTRPAGGGGSSALQAFPNRLDVSVNQANVDNAQSAVPVLTTRTGVNNVGGFNGGGTGNKAMLGIQGLNGMPLGNLNSLSWIWQELEEAHTNPLGLHVYANIIIEPNPIGFPGVYKILVFTDTLSPVSDVITTPVSPGVWLQEWPTDSNKLVFCVNPPGPVPPPLVSVWTTPPPGVPFFSAADNTYFTQLFRMADILAAYPNAIIVDASSGDGGLPNSAVIPALLLIVGDSNNRALVSRLISSILVNGNAV
jgi:hypothetical protein